jgi:outer membrane protein assembly factor BamB
MQSRSQRIGMAVAGVLLCVGVIISTIGVLQIREEHAADGDAAVATATAGPAATSTPAPLPPGNDWTQYRFDLAGSGLNPEKRITTSNVAQLQQRWSYLTARPFESTPAIVDGTIYVTNSAKEPNNNTMYALDLRTGKVLWRFDGNQQNRSAVSSSVAVDPELHLAFFGTPDAYVYAVDIRTGKEAWHKQIGDPSKGAYIWSSPLVVNGKVYVGLASRDDKPCVRGGLFAFDEETGKQAWVHYTSPQGLLGAAIWSSPAAIPEKHWIVVTTGNPCSSTVSGFEEDAILAMDWDTGKTVWKYTAMPVDDCDCDFGQGPVVYTYKGQQYVVAGNKFGKIWGLRIQGNGVQLAWTYRITGSGYLGEGGIFEPPSYANGIVYLSGGPTLDGACKQGAIWALRADSGKVVWSKCSANQVVSPSALTGGVLFVPQFKTLVAYDAATGKTLWSAPTNGSAWGGVAIAHGWVVMGSVPGRLYAFSLPDGA